MNYDVCFIACKREKEEEETSYSNQGTVLQNCLDVEIMCSIVLYYRTIALNVLGTNGTDKR